MNILVTNDDGILAPGIRALVEVARTIGTVIVVAPNTPQSGQGHAMTLEKPLRLHQVDVFDGIEAYECSGTPVDCVKLAKHIILKDRKVDLCLSGINHGSNAAINIIYSGTMSAAMEAALEGIHAIGFSLDDYRYEADFTAAQHYVKQIAEQVLAAGERAPKLLNVNIPALPLAEIKGVKVCRQAEGYWREEFISANEPRGQAYYWLTGKFTCDDTDEDADYVALQNGYVAVVPAMHDLTDYKSISKLDFLIS